MPSRIYEFQPMKMAEDVATQICLRDAQQYLRTKIFSVNYESYGQLPNHLIDEKEWVFVLTQ